MCPQCKKIMDLWRPKRKVTRKASPLARFVPQHIQEVNRYFDVDLRGMIYVMKCNHCDQIFHVPH